VEVVSNVRKGEKGISILAPCSYRVEEKDSTKFDGGVSWKLKGFKVAYAFDVSQTEGEPLDEGGVAQLLEGNAPEGMWDSLCTLIERDGYSVCRADCGAANGFTDRTAREVVVAPHLSDAASVKTLAHELAHVRQGSDHLSTVSRSLCEVEAESVAFIVCNAHGLNSEPYSIGYVAGWAKGDTEVVKKTAAWVVKEAHRIIEESEANRAVTSAA
jgi:antirestriction protein ArdC